MAIEVVQAVVPGSSQTEGKHGQFKERTIQVLPKRDATFEDWREEEGNITVKNFFLLFFVSI